MLPDTTVSAAVVAWGLAGCIGVARATAAGGGSSARCLGGGGGAASSRSACLSSRKAQHLGMACRREGRCIGRGQLLVQMLALALAGRHRHWRHAAMQAHGAWAVVPPGRPPARSKVRRCRCCWQACRQSCLCAHGADFVAAECTGARRTVGGPLGA